MEIRIKKYIILEETHMAKVYYEDSVGTDKLEGKKIAVIGYCFGGTGALEAARAQFPVNGVISIHGGLGKDASRPNGSLPTKILIEHPAEDQSVPQEMVNNLIKEMNEGKAD